MPQFPYLPRLTGEIQLPQFLRLARGVVADIRGGRLVAGQRLPGTRSLARALGVHRNTAIAAYEELTIQGWLSASERGGTFVAGDIPATLPEISSGKAPDSTLGKGHNSTLGEQDPGFELRDSPALNSWTHANWSGPTPRSGTLELASGMPDLRLVPHNLIARAYRRALRLRGASVLGYGDPRGHEKLREGLAAMLKLLRGLKLTPDNLMITRGSQMALDLVSRCVLAPGDVVAVEALGYPPAWGALRLAGAELAPLPIDANGLSVEALANLLRRRSIRAVYTTPHHQYPTTVTLGAGRRLALLEMARQHRFAIIEDDYDFEFHYGRKPVLPLASSDDFGCVVYLGTMSKILAPALRLGYVVAPTRLLDRMATIRKLCDRQGDAILEIAIAELLVDGEIQRHAQRMCRLYRERRDALVEALMTTFGAEISLVVPQGGMAIWASLPDDTDVNRWAQYGQLHGVQFSPGSRFQFYGSAIAAMRLGFAPLTPEELRNAVQRMAAARKDMRLPKSL